MADPAPIAAVTIGLRTLLQDAIGASGSIAVVRGDDIVTGAFTPPALAVLLYRVQVNAIVRGADPRRPTTDGLALDLHYLVTAHADDALAEQQLLAAGVQAIHDTPVP